MALRSSLLIVLSLLLFAGCGGARELESGLDSRQAIEMMVVLSRANITAERERVSGGKDERFRVTVPTREYQRALELIHEYRLPQRTQDDFEAVTRPQGFVPNSPELSLLRLDYALSVRIEQLLAALPGVLEVRALVRSNFKDQRFDRTPSNDPSASVVIRYVPDGSGSSLNEEMVRTIVIQAVPGIAPNAVSVAMSAVQLPIGAAQYGTAGGGEVVPLTQLRPFFVFRVPEEDLDKATKQLLLYTIAFCFAGMVLGAIWTSILYKRRLTARRRKSADGKRGIFIEAGFNGGESASRPLLQRGETPKRKEQQAEG